MCLHQVLRGCAKSSREAHPLPVRILRTYVYTLASARHCSRGVFGCQVNHQQSRGQYAHVNAYIFFSVCIHAHVDIGMYLYIHNETATHVALHKLGHPLLVSQHPRVQYVCNWVGQGGDRASAFRTSLKLFFRSYNFDAAVAGLPCLPTVISVEPPLASSDPEVRLDAESCTLDEADLAAKLEKISGHKGAKAICILSAGSNVTGLLADVKKLTSIIHRYGGIACWDYAATAGHVQPDLNPPGFPDAAVDVAFFSPHKLLGGPSTPGLLVAKKRLLRNAVPAVPGGGVGYPLLLHREHSHQLLCQGL